MAVLDISARPLGLTRQAVETLARNRGEPDWLLRQRLEAFATYQVYPADAFRTGNWRHESIEGLDLDNQQAYFDESQAVVAPDEPSPANAGVLETVRGIDTAGVLRQRDGLTVEARLAPGVAAAGVRLLDLAEALVDPALGERVRTQLGQTVQPGSDRLTALHYAFRNAGLVLHVPRGVAVERPVVLDHRVRTPGLAHFPHVLVLVDDDAQVSLLNAYTSTTGDGAPVSSGVVEMVVGRNARVRYVHLQACSPDRWVFSHQRAQLGADAQLRSLNVELGGRFVRNLVEVALKGNGSQADVLGLVPGRGRQQVDFQTLQDHFGSATRSDLVIHTALADRSRANFTGLIRINLQARQTESSQSQRNILLSARARADSDPRLEILNNDVVRCTHGASVGPLDPETMFYLQSRGLSEVEAQGLVLQGFLQTVVERLDEPALQVRVWEAVAPLLGVVTDGA